MLINGNFQHALVYINVKENFILHALIYCNVKDNHFDLAIIYVNVNGNLFQYAQEGNYQTNLK